jgi:hypothetical protein
LILITSGKISFFGGIDFGRVGKPGLTEDENLIVASYKEFSPPECLRALQYFDEPALSDLEESVKRTLKEAVDRVLALESLPKIEFVSYSLR